MLKYCWVFALLLFFIYNSAEGQLDQLQFSKTYLTSNKYEKALQKFEKIGAENGFNTELLVLLARTNLKVQRYNEAEEWYKKAIENPSIAPEIILGYVELLRYNSKVAMVDSILEVYHDYDDSIFEYWEQLKNFEYKVDDEIQLRNIQELNSAKNDEVVSNSFHDLLFRRKEQSKRKQEGKFHLYRAKLNTDFTINKYPEKHKKFVRGYHAGRLSFSISGNYAVAVRERNNLRKRKHHELFWATRNEKGAYNWQKLFDVKNQNYDDVDPSMSSDGTTIFFASNRPGGYGGFDLYETNLIDGTWQLPVNLGPEINSDGDERFPFFHQNAFLYFSSDGGFNYGGFDIYKSNLLDNVKTKALLPRPINSERDDIAYTLLNNQSFLFSSNRNGGNGGMDIYGVQLESVDDARQLTFQIKNEDGLSISGASISIINLSSNIEYLYMSDKDGVFSHFLLEGDQLNVRITHSNYLRFEQVVNVQQTSNPIEIVLSNQSNDFLDDRVIYKIQIGAFGNLESLNRKKLENVGKFSLEPLSNGITRVLIGEYTDLTDAQSTLILLRNLGYKDAYIQKYRGMKRID